MKQGVAMATKYLTETLKLDVSVVNVEIVISPQDLMDTDGCVAACFLDAGCAAIVTDGLNLLAMDVAKIPRNRLVAHFQNPFASSSNPTSDSDLNTKGMKDAITAAAELASIVTVQMSESDKPDAESIIEILNFEAIKQKELDFQVIVQFLPADCSCESDDDLAALVATISKSCKDGHGNVTLVDPTANQLGLSYAACMKTDRPDGLFTTVVCTRSGEALGLVYSSKVIADVCEVIRYMKSQLQKITNVILSTGIHCGSVGVWSRRLLLSFKKRPLAQGRYLWSLSNAPQTGCRLRRRCPPIHGDSTRR
jgi:hypothetical protein